MVFIAWTIDVKLGVCLRVGPEKAFYIWSIIDSHILYTIPVQNQRKFEQNSSFGYSLDVSTYWWKISGRDIGFFSVRLIYLYLTIIKCASNPTSIVIARASFRSKRKLCCVLLCISILHFQFPRIRLCWFIISFALYCPKFGTESE